MSLSALLFIVRGVWMLMDSSLLQQRWVRIVPHVIDTVLLLSAIALALLLRQYPFVHGWLTAKVLALVLYIILGMVALRRGKSRRVRSAAWIGALLTFAYIVSVAIRHDPWPLG